MRRGDSPPAGSRLRRTLQSLRSPFRGASPFHLGARGGSGRSSASDGDLARDERTMRKRNKKTRDPAASAASAATAAPAAAAGPARSSDSSPAPDKRKKDGFMRRMGSIGKKRAEDYSSAPSLQQSTKESSLESEPLPRSEPSGEPSSSPPPSPESPPPAPKPTEPPAPPPSVPAPEPSLPPPPVPEPSLPSPPAPEPPLPSLAPSSPTPETVSPISVVHPVATRPFAKAAWRRRRRSPELARPVEERSASSRLRRVALVSQASQASEEEGAGVGSLEEVVARALSAAARPDMPAYGDLIEPRQPPSHASPSAERREHLYKILVIGELGTGKTSIIKRYVHQFFSQHYRATIGVDFALKVLNWDANTVIRLQLWDIAGQERFGNMTRVYYKEAVGAFIVFDVSRVATFDAVVKWKNDLDSKVQLPDGSPIPCVLLANKCDQQKEGIVNSPAKMEEYCRERGFAGWFETSAKENINIEEAARSLVNKILLNDKLLQSNDNRDGEKFALEHKIANGENSRDSSKSCNC